MKMVQEFKEFAVKGNVIDMAVGVIIGTAFGRVVSSFVADVVMPPLGVLISGVDFSELAFTVRETAGEEVPAAVIYYGRFVQTIIDFIIITFVIFMAIRFINRLKRNPPPVPVVPASPLEPSTEEKLLTEIRDLLRSNSQTNP